MLLGEEAMKKPTTLRIPEPTREAIEELTRRTGRPFASVVNEMLAEAVRMRRIPGITFVDGPMGRRARLAGTGLDVFEVVRSYRELGQDLQRLREAYHWLSDPQLRAALAYAEAYPDEIEARVAADARWDAEAVAERYPFTRP